MLIGEYRHTLDPKKRVSLPARFRKILGKKVVITKGFESCLFVYPESAWKKVSEKLAQLSTGRRDTRGLNRLMFGGAVISDVDSLGRVLIPDFLKDFAHLKTEVVVIGVHERVEIWDEKTWNAYKSTIEGEADTIAEKLGEIGVF